MATTTVLIDKFAFVQSLEKRGFTRAQAEGIAETVTDIALAQLVSKVDLREALSVESGALEVHVRCDGCADRTHRRSYRTPEMTANPFVTKGGLTDAVDPHLKVQMLQLVSDTFVIRDLRAA